MTKLRHTRFYQSIVTKRAGIALDAIQLMYLCRGAAVDSETIASTLGESLLSVNRVMYRLSKLGYIRPANRDGFHARCLCGYFLRQQAMNTEVQTILGDLEPKIYGNKKAYLSDAQASSVLNRLMFDLLLRLRIIDLMQGEITIEITGPRYSMSETVWPGITLDRGTGRYRIDGSKAVPSDGGARPQSDSGSTQQDDQYSNHGGGD